MNKSDSVKLEKHANTELILLQITDQHSPVRLRKMPTLLWSIRVYGFKLVSNTFALFSRLIFLFWTQMNCLPQWRYLASPRALNILNTSHCVYRPMNVKALCGKKDKTSKRHTSRQELDTVELFFLNALSALMAQTKVFNPHTKQSCQG